MSTAGEGFRVGSGFDLHRLEPGRPLILGGVEVPGVEKGAVGHSDGDCLLHALVDALLGAAALGDIGEHFPDTDPSLAGVSSDRFVTQAASLLAERGFITLNVDATVFLEHPRLGRLKERMAQRIANLLELEREAVNIKAKTAEGLGSVGAGRAVAAQVTVLIRQR